MTNKKASRKQAEDQSRRMLSTVVVDDSERILEQVCEYLETVGGFDIVGRARNGAEALACVERLSPDLVVMDLSMPVMDGLEATRRIKTRANPPKVVILTLEDAPDTMGRALNAGADGFCHKVGMDEGLVPQIANLFPNLSLG